MFSFTSSRSRPKRPALKPWRKISYFFSFLINIYVNTRCTRDEFFVSIFIESGYGQKSESGSKLFLNTA